MCFLGIGIVEYAEYASCSSVVLGGDWPQEDPQAVLQANLQPDGQTHGPPGKVGQTARECQRIAKMIHSSANRESLVSGIARTLHHGVKVVIAGSAPSSFTSKKR